MLKKIFNSLEYIFVISSLILYTGGVLDLVAIDGFSEGDGIYSRTVSANEKLFVIKQLLYYFTYIASFILLTKTIDKFTKISAIFSRNIHVLLLVGWAVMSTTWSELPSLTASRAVALVGTTIFGIYLANRYTLKAQLLLLRHTFLAIVLLSIAFAIFLPQYGVMGALHAGAWRGIYTHKNELGRMMALGAIVLLMQPGSEGENKMLSLQTRSIGTLKQYIPSQTKENSSFYTFFGLIAAIGLIFLSRSSGGIVNLVGISIVLGIFKISQLRLYQRFFSILGTVVLFSILAVIIVPNPEMIFASIGKSSDLTGRGDLWDILLDMLSTRPLLGFGYGIFWENYGLIVALAAGWDVPHAHNGFLDLTLGVGLLGLGLFTIGYFYTFVKGLVRFRNSQSDENIYPLVVLIYIIISNISETGLFSYNNIYWLLFVTLSHSMVVWDKKNILPPNPQFF